MILNKKKLTLRGSKVIKTILGDYHRALETKDFIFFVNFEESDENASVKMFDRKLQLISDNYFACEALTEELEGKRKNVTWMSKKMVESLESSK